MFEPAPPGIGNLGVPACEVIEALTASGLEVIGLAGIVGAGAGVTAIDTGASEATVPVALVTFNTHISR